MSKNTFGGINGFQVNKVGSVVGYKYRGEQVYRGYQKNVANPRTTAQVRNRARFSNLSSLLRQTSMAIRAGFFTNAKGTKWSQRNFAYRVNYPLVYSTPTDTEIDYSKVVLSRGNLFNTAFDTLDLGTVHQVDVPVLSVPYAGDILAKMEIFLVVYSPVEKAMAMTQKTMQAAKNDGVVSIVLPESWSGETVYVYAFTLYNAQTGVDSEYGELEQGSTSDSMYLGSGLVS